MRPVEKKKPGDTVRYLNSNNQVVVHTLQEHYPHYKDALFPLVGNLGSYCSYCEQPQTVDVIDVEHIVPKSEGGSYTAWNNFLLCCKICNSVKGTKKLNPDTGCQWPHLNNTFYSFVYDETGRVRVNDHIPEISKQRAQKLLDLTQLQRYPGTDNPLSPKDFRWHKRYQTWNIASTFREQFLKGAITEDDVITNAKLIGQWSVWFTVFKGIDCILRRLISDFPGTCASCFDENNHYEPVERNPGCIDPI
ncbi:uncharacterized protein BN812_00975 [Prevotella sp. CAG:924]|nr:uncharacterized protein BN812_00975 [Prevotella sp. CAG:924]